MRPAIPPTAAPTVPVYPALGSANFNQEAFTYGASMPGVSAALGELAANVAENADIARENAYDAEQHANAASKYEAMAGIFASTAAAAVDVTRWLSITQGGLYRAGDVVYSPINGQLYRRKGDDPGVAIGTDTDPSADPLSWWLIGAPFAAPIVKVAADIPAQVGMHYVFTAGALLTLPASPAPRDIVQFTDLSQSRNARIDPQGKKIRGQTGVMRLEMLRARFSLIYLDEETGWI